LAKLHVDFQASIEKSVLRPKHWFSQFQHKIPKSLEHKRGLYSIKTFSGAN
jgi:hypothetical protein